MRLIKFLIICLIFIPNLLKAQPGALDPSFGQGGVVVSAETKPYRSILPLADGKFLVTNHEEVSKLYENGAILAYTYSTFWRYYANGTVDPTYGTNGKREFFSSDVSHNYFTSFARLTDGRIVATESEVNNGTTFNLNKIWRFNSDGTGGQIIAELSASGYFSVSIKAIAVDHQNRIVVTGYVRSNDYKNRLYIARLLADGNLDGTFNSGNGFTVVEENSNYAYYGEQIVTDPNNNIIIVEQGYYSTGGPGYYISKFLENGSKEITFGNVKTTSRVETLLTDKNSRIIFLAGGIKRLNSNGSLDISYSQASGVIDKLVIQPNNKIVGVGTVGPHATFYVCRFGEDGTLDQTFGTNGSITTDLNFSSITEDAIYFNKRLYLTGYIVVNSLAYGTILAYDATNVLLDCPENKNVSVNASKCYATLGSIAPILIPPPVRPDGDRGSNITFDPYALITYSKEHNGNVQTGSGSVNGTVFDLGTTHVTYTYTDVTVQTCSFDVIVTDQDPPVARCKNITIQLSASGIATISAAAVDNGSTDGCGIKSMSLSKTSFDCSNVGNNTVILTVTDNNNNQSTCTATVTVEAVTRSSPIHFAVTFNEPVPGLTNSDISFAGSTAPGILVATVSGGPLLYDVAVTGISGAGTVVLSISPTTTANLQISSPATICPSSVRFIVDQIGPAVTINQSAGQPDPTSSSPIHFTATFNQTVSNFDGTDISFTGSTAGGILSATVTPNGFLSYDVAVSGMTTTGTVVASILPGVVQGSFLGFYNQGSTSTDNSVTYNPTLRPSVTINKAVTQTDPTSVSPLHFTVTFSDRVTGFTGFGISFTGSTAPGNLSAIVTGGPFVYDVAVRGMTGPGNVVASVPGNVAFTTSGAANLSSTSSDNTIAFNVASSGPTVTINQSSGQVDPTANTPIQFTVTFSDPVFDFDASDISFAGSTVGGVLTAVVQSNILTGIHEVSVSGMTTKGTVVASVLPGVAHTLFGITNKLSTSTDNSVLFDPFIPPTVTINQAVSQSDPTFNSPLRFTVTFSQPVTGFTGSDLSFAGSTVQGTLMATVTGGPYIYNVDVRGMTNSGNVVVSVPAGVAQNMSAVSNLVSTSTDNIVMFNVSSNGPTVTINQSSGQVDPTANTPIQFTVTFSSPVFDFDASDISFAGSTVGGVLTAVVQSNILTGTHEVSVSGMTTTGTVVVSVLPGVAHSLFGGTNALSTSTDNTVLYNPFIPPTVTVNKAITQSDPTPVSPLHFTVTFSQPVGVTAIPLQLEQGGGNHFTASDISFAGSTAPGNLIATVSGGPTVYDVAVRGMTGVGSVVVSVPAGAAANFSGVNNLASTSTDNTIAFTVASSGPTVTINQSSDQTDPTAISPVRFTVSFSEPVLNFDASDISFSGSTVGGTLVAQVQPDLLSNFRNYEVSVTGMTDPGTVVTTILPGVANALFGETNKLSTSTDNSVLYVSPPTVIINPAAGQSNPTSVSPIHFTVTFNQGVTDFSSSDILFTGSTAPGTLIATVTGGPSVYDIAVSGMTGSGNVVISIPSNAAVNIFAVGSLASASVNNIVAYILPLTVTINQAANQADPTIISPVHFTATFSKPVTGFTSSDISFTGSTASGTLIATITGGPEVFDVGVSGMTSSGLVVASVPLGSAVNASLVSNFASTSTDNAVLFNYCVATYITSAPSAAEAAQCSSNFVNFSISATGTDLHYQWKVDGTNVGIDANSLSYNPSSLAAGIHSITVDVTNTCSSVNAATTLTINADETPPVISGCPSDQTISLTATACTAIATWTEPTATDNCSTGNLTYFSRSNAPGSVFALGTTTVTYVFKDLRGNQSTCTFTITVQDITAPVFSNVSVSKPVLIAANHKMVDITVGYDIIDGCSTTSTLSVSSNEPISGTSGADLSPDWVIIDNHHLQLRAERDPKGNGRIYTITITATDASGNVSVTTKTVVAAHNIPAPVSGTAVKIGSSVNLSGTFWDVPGNKHTAKWLIDDNTTTNGAVTEPSGLKNGTVSGSYKFTSPGVYKLQMNITDQKGITTYTNTNGDLEAIVVVYDPNGGYTYGGGYYTSPAGALKSNPSASGDVSYGFTMNYYKNATLPKGETQFDFKLGDFEFNALNFEYLAINNSMAQFKGTGKIIGGQSGVGFTMTVTDGQLDGSGVDKIRMKIYNKNTGSIIYDNQPGASDAALPTQAVGANSVNVISGANSNLITANRTQNVAVEAEPEEVSNAFDVIAFPNPSTHNFTISVKGSAKEKAIMQVTDVYGRVIETRNVTANSITRFGDRYISGTYFIRIMQGKEHKEIKLIKLSD